MNNRISQIISCALVLAMALNTVGCGRWAQKKEVPITVLIIQEVLNEEVPILDGTPVYNPDIIKQLYLKSANQLSAVWDKRANIDQMLYAIRNVSLDGLNPEDYHLFEIELLANKIILSNQVEVEDIAKLELLLTDSFILLTAHLAGGKTDAHTIDPQWRALKRIKRLDLGVFIDSTLHNSRIIEGLKELTPKHREYTNLKKALVTYRNIRLVGGWETFSTVLPKIEIGMRHTDVAKLRMRLAISQGNIMYDIDDENLFDENLFEHVLTFQLRNGLTPDGVVGKATVEALNISVEDRIASIEANLERWRWINDELGARYIKVNIANFELQAIEQDTLVFVFNAIVGREFRETPVFSSTISYLVLNPNWTIPPTILNEDIVPAIISNPAYLKEKDLKVISANGAEVDPATIDWSSVVTSGFPYTIQQDPGPNNALGNVKFMFPNKYNVYIHDTPSRNLFKRTERSFSSGCIRVDSPLVLAAWLTMDNPKWSLEQIEKVIEKGKTQTIKLASPIPVHILYLTAWASNDGVVYFRKDIYNRDKPLLAALKEKPPGKAH